MKKLLSIVLTLALLLTALPLALGMTASAAGTGDYAIYFDNSSNGNNFWVTKRNDDHPEIGMEELNLPAGETYTVEFDVYALTAGSNVVFGATKSTWDTTTAIEKGHQVWKEAPATTNTWTHYSFNVKTTETWNGVIFYVIGDGFKGYIDNLTIKDSTGNVAASFEPTAADLTKTSNCGSIVELTADLAYAKNPDVAILIDNADNDGYAELYSNELDMPNASVPAGNYTVQYDFYAISAGNQHMHYGASIAGYNGSAVDQVWRSNCGYVENEWATYSFNITVKDTMVYQKFWIGAGIKGYLDNWKILDANGNVVYSYEGDAAKIGKVSHERSSVVTLPQEISEAKNIVYAYKIEIDAEGKLFRTAYDGSLGEGASIKFDYYLVSGKVKVDGTNESGAYLNKGVGSFELSVPVSKSFTITSRSAEFVELYIWNVEVTQAGKTLEFKSYEGRTNCDWEKILLSDVPEYVETNYALLVDTTGIDNGTPKDFWFNELGLPTHSNLVAGETYTIAFDVYPIVIPEGNNLFHYRNSSGNNGSTQAGWWKGDLVVKEWNATSNTFTVSDAIKTGNNVIYVYGGFKGYIDNVRVLDKNGNVVSGTATNFTGLTVPSKHEGLLEIVDITVMPEEPACDHTNVGTANVVSATYFKPGSKDLVCDCGEVIETGVVIPAANDALVGGFVTKYEDGKYTITFDYSDALALDVALGAKIYFNYSIAGHSKTVAVNGEIGGEVVLEGFNADRLNADLTYFLSAEYDVDTAKLENVKETVKAADKADAEVKDFIAALNNADATIAGEAANTADLVESTIKLDVKAGTANIRFVASDELVAKLAALGRDGREVTLCIVIDGVEYTTKVADLRKATALKVSGLSFANMYSDISVKLAFDYEGTDNDFATVLTTFECDAIVDAAEGTVAEAFENLMK